MLASFTKNIAVVNKCNDSNVFLSKNSTNTLKGFSIIMIVMAHICQYEESFKEILIGGDITYKVLFSWGATGVSLFFLLSGYGCFLSLSKTEKRGKWLAKHVIRMLIHYVIVFFSVICVLKFVFNYEIRLMDGLKNFITLQLPGSTVWYFKIQILFYIVLYVSMQIHKKRACFFVFIFSLCYGLIAKYAIGLSDYWWKTSLCFSAGCFIAQYRETVENFLRGFIKKFALGMMGCISYILILLDNHYVFALQIVAYLILAICITMFWDWHVKDNIILEIPGKCSLDVYLFHIGIVEAVFVLTCNINVKIIILVVSVIIMSFLCFRISEYLYKNGILCFRKTINR